MSDKRPCIGCSCGASALFLVADDFAEPTTVIAFVCVVCQAERAVYIPLDKIAPREEIIDEPTES
jgi:hypothetical protein